MHDWREQLRFDPITPLLASGNVALQYWTRRDLLGEEAGPVQRLWELPQAQRILRKQQSDGSWPRPESKQKHAATAINHGLIETWRHFRFLVEQYGFTREHPQAERACEFLFSCQTDVGDIRGMIANQYATYYTGAILSSIIQAGYQDDPRVEKGMRWLLSMRQDDGGWTIPLITRKLSGKEMYFLTSEYAEPVEPDRSKPFSHNWTGMVLRAFAVHEGYCHSEAARRAAHLLASRFFQPDVYTSYQAASYWVRFEYPFWWNNLLAALDSISRIGVSGDDPQIRQALDWLIAHQQSDGLWQHTYVEGKQGKSETAKVREAGLWVSLAICRVFARSCA